jgi:hypothetical protein
LDDTARAALLSLAVYERTRSRKALSLARRWLTFVEYMQYPDGDFANFIRNPSGVRNVSGPTSVKGGYWWSVRALWALARAYRLTGDRSYLDRFYACHLDPLPDGKINAVLALSKLELYRAGPLPELRRSIIEHCEAVVGMGNQPYFLDHPESELVQLWGYHQLHATASTARLLDRPELLAACRHTVNNLIEPAVRARFWTSYPDRGKDGVSAYYVTPMVQGLAEMYRATEAKRYRRLALTGAAWFQGRNDAGVPMHDLATGRCSDGITAGVASLNAGAESSVEAGFAELERRFLLSTL